MDVNIRLPRDRELINLLVSGFAVLLGLLWMFFGSDAINFLVASENTAVFYYFFSGVIFSLTFVGLYGFIRTILCFTEFMIEQDNLTGLMYENLLSNEHEGIFLKNKHGAYKLISPVATIVLNLQNKQVIGVTDQVLHNPRKSNKIIHEDKQVLNFGETVTWETTRNTSNGEETYLCTKFPCRDHKGKIVGIIGVCKNITQLKSFQNLSKLQEVRYRNLFNKLPYPVLVLDSISLQPYTFNDAMNRLLGYDKEEFSHMRMSLHVEPDDLVEFKKSITETIKANGGEFEIRLVTKQRDHINVTGYSQEIVIDNKVYLHLLLYDNTETKKSTDILISSELKYRSLFEHANDAIIVVSPNTLNITDANEIAISFLGYKRDELLLMSIYDLDAASDHRVIQDKIADLEIYNHALCEHEFKNHNGEILDVEINAHKVNYGNEDVYQFVLRNVSARKHTEAALRSSENRYRQMFESNMAIKLVINPDSFSIEDANPAAVKFYGYSLIELKGMNLAQINILSRDKLNTIIKQTREQNLGFYSCPHRLANGEIRFVEVRDGPMEIDGKQLFYSIIHDVTASKEAENQVLVASKMFDYSTDAVMLINDNNQIESVNYAFSQITGYQQAEILNKHPEVILAGCHETLLNSIVLQSIDESGQWKGEIWHRLKNGQSRPLNASINSIRNDTTRVSSYVVILSPKYSQLLEDENKVHYVELTQLPNKSLFIDRLQNAIDRAHRNNNHLGIILIDFRNFSDINNKHGYDVGDQILKSIAKRLKYNTRDSDTLSHFKSDDFAVLIEDLNDIQQIGIVAQKLLSTLCESYQSDQLSIEINASMGISIFPEDGKQPDQLITRANNALQAAQLIPGNNFQLTTQSLNKTANMWLTMEANLHRALRLNEFELTFLPQINTNNHSLTALEALIRWNHPERGYLLPMHFIPVAEQTGFIGAIGIDIFEQALKQYSTWLNEELEIPRLCLNISQSQIDSDLLEVLVSKCDKYNIAYHLVCLELSEKNLPQLTNAQIHILNQLHKTNFMICIDDFGAYNASLNLLLHCSVNAIKIHASLISQAQNSAETDSLLRGTVAMCHAQNIMIIAEGVETDNDFSYLRSLDITQMQGYFFSEPISAEDTTFYLRNLNVQPV